MELGEDNHRIKINCTSINPILELLAIGYDEGFMIYRYVDKNKICERGKKKKLKIIKRWGLCLALL